MTPIRLITVILAAALLAACQSKEPADAPAPEESPAPEEKPAAPEEKPDAAGDAQQTTAANTPPAADKARHAAQRAAIFHHLQFDPAVADQVLATDVSIVFKGARRPGLPDEDPRLMGRDQVIGAIAALKTELPDYHQVPRRILSTDDVVVVETVVVFTPAGETPAPGGQTAYPRLLLIWFNAKNQIQRIHATENSVDRLVQLGQMEPFENAPPRELTRIPESAPKEITDPAAFPDTAEHAAAFVLASYKARDYEAARAHLADPFQWQQLGGPGGVPAASIEHGTFDIMSDNWHAGIEVIDVVVDGKWATGSTAIVEWTLEGKHVGHFGPFPTTNKSFTQARVDVFEFDEHGKIVRRVSYQDPAAFLTQLGFWTEPVQEWTRKPQD